LSGRSERRPSQSGAVFFFAMVAVAAVALVVTILR